MDAGGHRKQDALRKGDLMRNEILLNLDWAFVHFDGLTRTVDLPHTWNAVDGQDGGNDYRRGTCIYHKRFHAPQRE